MIIGLQPGLALHETWNALVKSKRFWLAFWYALAALVVPAFHDHREADEDVVATAIAGCEDPGTHLSGHGAPDLTHHELDCPACQFRAEHQAITLSVALTEAPRSDASTAILASLRESVPVTRFAARAPPLA